MYTGDLQGGNYAMDIAQNASGYYLHLEHRFYGKSIPGDGLILDNLQYLTIRQSLADIHDFIDYARNDLAGDPDAAVVLIGANYGGTLGVWYQSLYPGIVSVVWASSAPVLANIGFPNYLERVGEIFGEIGGESCLAKVQFGIEHVESLYRNQSWSILEEQFKVCNASTPENDVRAFLVILINNLSEWVQLSLHLNIKSFCGRLEEYPRETALSDYYRKRFGDHCEPIDQQTIDRLINTYYRAWLYQQCSGLGWIGTTSSRNQPFGTILTVDVFSEVCQRMFGSQ